MKLSEKSKIGRESSNGVRESLKVNFLKINNRKRNLLKRLKIIINMIKVREDLQIYTLLAIGAALLLFLFHKFDTPYPLLNLILTNSKYYITPIMIMCFLPPLGNLISSMGAENGKYDERPYQKLMKAYLHLSSIALLAFVFVWGLGFLVLLFFWFSGDIKVATILPLIIMIVAYFVMDALFQKYFNIRWYQIFYWAKT